MSENRKLTATAALHENSEEVRRKGDKKYGNYIINLSANHTSLNGIQMVSYSIVNMNIDNEMMNNSQEIHENRNAL